MENNFASRSMKFFILLLFLSFTVCLFSIANAEQKAKTLSGLNMQEFDTELDSNINWQSNPFVKPADQVPVSELKLTGIVYGGDESAAVIDNQIVRKGDKVGFSEVIAIEKTKVILRNENGLFSLSMKGK